MPWYRRRLALWLGILLCLSAGCSKPDASSSLPPASQAVLQPASSQPVEQNADKEWFRSFLTGEYRQQSSEWV